MALDNHIEDKQDTQTELMNLWAVWLWLEICNAAIKKSLEIQTSFVEESKTLALQTTRAMQDNARTACNVLSHSRIPEVAHYAKVTESYIFNTHKRKFEIPNAKSLERVNFHPLADIIHVTPELINPNIRPKLVIPAASSHDEMLAQDTSAAMTRYETDHHVLARKSWEDLDSGIDSTMNAEIGMMVEALKLMNEKYPDGFDVLAICEGTQVGFIASMVCLEEYWFAPRNFVWIAAATFPDAYPSEVSTSSREVSNKDVDSLSVNLPSWVRVIPAEINILNFLGQSFQANAKRALELYTKWLHDEDLTRKGIHQNHLMMNGRSFTSASFLGTEDELGKKDRYFTDPELQKGYWIFNGKKYPIKNYNTWKYITVGWDNDEIAPPKQGDAILEELDAEVRWNPIRVTGGHYSTFTWSNWRKLWYPWIVQQTDWVTLDPAIFKEDIIFAA